MTGDVHMALTLDPKDVATVAAIIRRHRRDQRDDFDAARAIAKFIEGLDLKVNVALPADAPAEPQSPALPIEDGGARKCGNCQQAITFGFYCANCVPTSTATAGT